MLFNPRCCPVGRRICLRQRFLCKVCLGINVLNRSHGATTGRTVWLGREQGTRVWPSQAEWQADGLLGLKNIIPTCQKLVGSKIKNPADTPGACRAGRRTATNWERPCRAGRRQKPRKKPPVAFPFALPDKRLQGLPRSTDKRKFTQTDE